MQGRKLAAMLTLLAMVAALMPLTASVAFAGDQGDSGLCQCDPLFQKQIQTRTFDPGRDEVTEDQYRWHRSFGGDKQVKGWEYEDGWKNRNNDNWYTIPAFLNPPFIGTISPTGTVSLSHYGGPNVTVQYRYTEQGEEWYPSEDGYASEEDFQANATGGGWLPVAENPANPVVIVEGIEPSYGPWGPWTPFGGPTTDPKFDGIKVLDRAGPGDEGGDDAVKRARYVDAGEDCSNLTYTVEVPADTEGVTYAFGQFGGGWVFTELEPTNLDPGTYTVFAQVQDGFEVGDPGEWTQAENDPTVFYFNVKIEEGSKPCVREVPPLGATEIPEPDPRYVCEDGEIVEIGPDDPRYEDAAESPEDLDCEVPEETTTTTIPEETTTTTVPPTTTTEPEPEQEETTTTTVPEETSSTTTEPEEEEETPSTLPFTGPSDHTGVLAGAGLLALIAGAGLTFLARKGEEAMDG